MDWWTLIGLAFITWLVLVLLFTPRIDYHVTVPLRPDSDEFLHVIQSTCQAAIHRHNRVEIFTNGAQFYPAMRDAILRGRGRRSISRPTSSSQATPPTCWSTRWSSARRPGSRCGWCSTRSAARACGNAAARRLRDARLPASTSTSRYAGTALHRLNNRTHRELLVVDGRVAFTGGAGVADWWYKPTRGPTWRDTMARDRGADRRGAAGRVRRELARSAAARS